MSKYRGLYAKLQVAAAQKKRARKNARRLQTWTGVRTDVS